MAMAPILEARIRSFLDSFLGDESDPEWRRLVVRTFVDRVFVTKGRVAVTFNMGPAEEEVPFERIREVLGMEKARTSSSGLVRANKSWWTFVCVVRTSPKLTIYRMGLTYVIVESAA